MRIKSDGFLYSLLMLVALVFMFYAGAVVAERMIVKQGCLDKGFPDYEVTFELVGYCVSADGRVRRLE